MSHWVKCKLKVSDEGTLVKALQRMGATNVQTGSHSITQEGTTDTASIWLDNAVGFKKEADGTYSMIGDPYYSKDFKKYYQKMNLFEEELTVAYAVEDTQLKFDSLNLGFSLTGNLELEESEDGLIHLEFETWNDI